MRGLVIAVALAGQAAAHELRPAIADLVITPGPEAELTLQVTLEAVLADLGPAHDSAGDSAAQALYDRLHALPGAELAARFAEAEPTLIVLRADGARVDPGPAALDVPPPPDADIPRIARVTWRFALPEGAQALDWTFRPGYAPSVLRVTRNGADAPGFAELVAPGKSTTVRFDPPLRGGGPAWWAIVLGVAGLAGLAGGGVALRRSRG